jgi:hypothetical protein
VRAQAPTLSAPAIVGRWDLTVHGARGDYPSWLEVWTSGNEHLVGQFVGSGGSARPVSLVEFADGKVRFLDSPAVGQAARQRNLRGHVERRHPRRLDDGPHWQAPDVQREARAITCAHWHADLGRSGEAHDPFELA